MTSDAGDGGAVEAARSRDPLGEGRADGAHATGGIGSMALTAGQPSEALRQRGGGSRRADAMPEANDIRAIIDAARESNVTAQEIVLSSLRDAVLAGVF